MIVTNRNSISDAKLMSIVKGLQVIDTYQEQSSKMIKTASSGDNTLNILKSFIEALQQNGIESNIKESSSKLFQKDSGKISFSSSDDTIKIASKEVKDSHYMMDVSKDEINKKGSSLLMVSFFMREGYLGRYLIKRNYYYSPSNAKEANETYDELIRKSQKVKKRYLSDEIKTSGILPEVKAFLGGIVGDFEFKDEDNLGTTVQR